MKTLHVEFDCEVTDIAAEKLVSNPQVIQEKAIEAVFEYSNYIGFQSIKVKVIKD